MINKEDMAEEAELIAGRITRKYLVAAIVVAGSVIALYVNTSVQLANIESRLNDISNSVVNHIQTPAHTGQAIAQAENRLRFQQIDSDTSRQASQYERILDRLESISEEIEDLKIEKFSRDD